MKNLELRKISPVDIIRYYLTYKDIEEGIIKNIDSSVQKERVAAYNLYVNKHMKIGRNFRTGTVHMVLGTTKNLFMNYVHDVEKLSKNYFEGGLLSGNKRNAIVAASKLLWLFDHDIVIMDDYTKKVLGAKNYTDYTEKWNKAFNLKLNEIDSIISLYQLDKIDSLINEKWFKMRVFDQYLWSLGR